MKTPTVAEAVELAARQHRDATDKGGAPYILHPLRVMMAMTTDEARRVAVLHDVPRSSRKQDAANRSHQTRETHRLRGVFGWEDVDREGIDVRSPELHGEG